MGKVFDVYFKFGVVEDRYLGRVLAGLDPNDPDFGVFPPHFTVSAGNPFIKEAMELTFGELRAINPGSKGILVTCLACIVYHSNFLYAAIAESSGHSLCSLSLLQNRSLLNEVKKLVTLDGKETGLKATGVPPHVNILKGNATLKKKILYMVESLKEQTTAIVASVEGAILQNDVCSGILSLNTLE